MWSTPTDKPSDLHQTYAQLRKKSRFRTTNPKPTTPTLDRDTAVHRQFYSMTSSNAMQLNPTCREWRGRCLHSRGATRPLGFTSGALAMRRATRTTAAAIKPISLAYGSSSRSYHFRYLGSVQTDLPRNACLEGDNKLHWFNAQQGDSEVACYWIRTTVNRPW